MTASDQQPGDAATIRHTRRRAPTACADWHSNLDPLVLTRANLFAEVAVLCDVMIDRTVPVQVTVQGTVMFEG